MRTLTRACLAVTGRSAKQVIDERVALQARRLLAATDEPIAQIGRQLGFPEPTNFGRFFTREVGVSPGAFRAARDQPAAGRVVRPRPSADPTGANGGRFRSGAPANRPTAVTPRGPRRPPDRAAAPGGHDGRVQISARGDYAVRAALSLATAYPSLLSTQAIAAEQDQPNRAVPT